MEPLPVSGLSPASRTHPDNADTSAVAAVLRTGVALGGHVAGYLGASLSPRLTRAQRRDADRIVGVLSSVAASSGLALWSVATLVKSERAARVGAAVAGVAIGLTPRGRSAGALN